MINVELLLWSVLGLYSTYRTPSALRLYQSVKISKCDAVSTFQMIITSALNRSRMIALFSLCQISGLTIPSTH